MDKKYSMIIWAVIIYPCPWYLLAAFIIFFTKCPIVWIALYHSSNLKFPSMISLIWSVQRVFVFTCHSVIVGNSHIIILSLGIMVTWGLWETLGLYLNVMIYGGTDSIICSQKWLGIEKVCVNMPWSVPRIWFVDTHKCVYVWYSQAYFTTRLLSWPKYSYWNRQLSKSEFSNVMFTIPENITSKDNYPVHHPRYYSYCTEA